MRLLTRPIPVVAVLSAAALISLVSTATSAVEPPSGTPGPGGPVRFIANEGQLACAARYYAADREGAVFFERGSVLVSRSPSASTGPGLSIRVEFPSATVPPVPMGDQPLNGHVNWFTGNDPSRWQAGLPTFGEVRYRQIAPGSDLVYKAENGHLKYDLVVAPHGDLGSASLRYRGVDRLEVASDGSLLLHAGSLALREDAPVLYQEHDGIRVPVAGGYRLISKATVGFWAGPYDPALPLVVDPGMVWSTFIGGSGADYVYGAATDSNGDIYVVGSTASTDYATTAAYQSVKGAGTDVIVSKLRGDGRTLIWSTYLGGGGNEDGRAIVVDASGVTTITGNTTSLDFPVTSGAYRTSTTSASGVEAFVTRLGPSGGTLLFSTYLGGSWDDYPRAIALDSAGNPVVAGFTSSSDYPTTSGVVKLTRNPVFPDGADGFITKLAASGSALLVSTYLGTNGGTDEIFAIAIDAMDRLTVAGWTLSPGFPTTSGAYQTSFVADRDGFVTRLSPTASSYVYSTFLGGSLRDEPLAVAVDQTGSAYVAGRTSSTDFPTTPGAYRRSYGGGAWDGFVLKLSPNGDAASYSTLLGGSGSDAVNAIALTPAGEVCAAGSTDSNNFPSTPGTYDASSNGGTDAFLSLVSSTGASLTYSTYEGSAGADAAQAVCVQPSGRVILAGQTDNAGFPTTSGAADPSHNSAGSPDGFVSALDLGLVVATADMSPPPALAAVRARPNPFRDKMSIDLSLADDTRITVRVFDLRGRLVASLADGDLSAGPHRVEWVATSRHDERLSAGVYFIEVSTPSSGKVTRPVVLLR